jgi:hypothetical protein
LVVSVTAVSLTALMYVAYLLLLQD